VGSPVTSLVTGLHRATVVSSSVLASKGQLPDRFSL
jgi:hypothetical protein